MARMQNNQNFRRWIQMMGMVAVGLAVGLGSGLYLGWQAWPTEFTDAAPEILQESYRRDYAIMVATTYAGDGNLSAAERRIASLGPEGREFFYTVTLDAILRNENEPEIRYLARLAADLGLESPALDPYLSEQQNAETTAP